VIIKGDTARASGKANARIVNQEVDGTKAGDRGFYRRLYALSAGCINGSYVHIYAIIISDGFCRVLQRVCVNIGQHDVSACTGKSFGDRKADARGGACDEGGFVFKVFHSPAMAQSGAFAKL